MLLKTKNTYKFITIIALMSMGACKEKDVLIDFGLKDGVVDTTYTAAIEAPQPHVVFIEEFTGASCTNCPDGHKTVASILDANPGKVVAVAYHTFNPGSIFKPVNRPNAQSKYDLRDSSATQISTSIYGGVGSIPIAGIDRVMLGSSRLIGRNQWSSEVVNRFDKKTPINLYLKSEYRKDENKVKVSVKLAYTDAVALKHNLTIEVIENGIVDAQEFTDHIDENYVHEHVLRQILTPYNGYSVLDSIANKQAGRVYEYSYVFTPKENWNIDNCYLIAFVSNNEPENKEVIQVQQVKIK